MSTIVSSVDAAVTGRPRNVRITARTYTTLSISWSPPLITQRYGAILRYNISCLGSGVLQFHHTTGNSTRMVGLHPYTRYYCCISAITTMAEGARACFSTRSLETGNSLLNWSGHTDVSSNRFALFSPPKHPPLLPRV